MLQALPILRSVSLPAPGTLRWDVVWRKVGAGMLSEARGLVASISGVERKGISQSMLRCLRECRMLSKVTETGHDVAYMQAFLSRAHYQQPYHRPLDSRI